MNWRWWLCKIIGHRWKPRSLKEIKAEPWGWQTKGKKTRRNKRTTSMIVSRRGKAFAPAVVTDRITVGTCFVPMHFADASGADLAINAVTNDAVDPDSKQKWMAMLLHNRYDCFGMAAIMCPVTKGLGRVLYPWIWEMDPHKWTHISNGSVRSTHGAERRTPDRSQ